MPYASHPQLPAMGRRRLAQLDGIAQPDFGCAKQRELTLCLCFVPLPLIACDFTRHTGCAGSRIDKAQHFSTGAPGCTLDLFFGQPDAGIIALTLPGRTFAADFYSHKRICQACPGVIQNMRSILKFMGFGRAVGSEDCLILDIGVKIKTALFCQLTEICPGCTTGT